jgi:hypothetical protein
LDTIDKVKSLTEPIAEELGYELVDVEYVKEGKNWFLRLYIDKDKINMLIIYLKDYSNDFMEHFINISIDSVLKTIIDKKIITQKKLDDSKIGLNFGYIEVFNRSISITSDYLKNMKPEHLI